jgi:hypothetical protein|tara:strand:- start:334 stop:597 length:264 start_codon:yes stop_codon:yes gene_type:complete
VPHFVFLDDNFSFHDKIKIPTTRDSNTAKILSAKILSYSERIFQNFVTEKSSLVSSHPMLEFLPKRLFSRNESLKVRRVWCLILILF